jgi:hypothetical protein
MLDEEVFEYGAESTALDAAWDTLTSPNASPTIATAEAPELDL